MPIKKTRSTQTEFDKLAQFRNDQRTAEARKKVLNNPLLVEQILSHLGATDSAIDWRLINTAFNSAFIADLRKKNTKIEIHFEPSLVAIFVNDSYIQNLPKYLKYLTEVAKVRVEEFIIRQGDGQNEKEVLHKAILDMLERNRDKIKVFLGMESLCFSGCSKCNYIATHPLCEEYGPIQSRFFSPIHQPELQNDHHYKTLTVGDDQLALIANQTSEEAVDKDECLRLMNGHIHSNIRCDHLVLVLREKENRDNTIRRDLPREVIEGMIVRWGVKSVELTFEHREMSDVSDRYKWTEKDFYSKIRFDEKIPDEFEESRLKMEKVILTLTCNPWRIFKEIRRMYLSIVKGYGEIFDTARKMFPSERLHVKLPFPSNYFVCGVMASDLCFAIWERESMRSSVLRLYLFDLPIFDIRGTMGFVEFYEQPWEVHDVRNAFKEDYDFNLNGFVVRTHTTFEATDAHGKSSIFMCIDTGYYPEE